MRAGRRLAHPEPTEPSDRGAASVWLMCIAVVTLTFTVSTLLVGSAIANRHRAAAAADLAALAAADRVLVGAAHPCAVAERVASAHGARLSRCVVGAATVHVIAEVANSIGRLHLPPARAQAKAGAELDQARTSTRPP